MKEEKKQQVWGARMKSEPSVMNIYYCAGRDPFPRPPADELLIPYDIWLNKVHTLMLFKQNIVNAETARAILGALDKIATRYRKGEFTIDKKKEDVHITIEAELANLAGEEVAGYLHTARSRNDQSATDCRLYIRDRLMEFYSRLIHLIEILLRLAGEHTKTIMPGLTHYQPASLTTFCHFLLSHAQAFMRDLIRLGMTYEQWNASPLGAAAGFGTSWNIDRNYTAHLLGFTSVQENSLDCVTNRWELETQVTAAIGVFMNHLSILAQDLIILSLSPSPMIEISDAYVTGSSIMPQKRNPDFAEVTKAKAAACHGLTMELFSLSKAALSGYNRDTQWTKYVIIDLFDEVRFAPIIFTEVLSGLKVKKGEMKARCSRSFITAVDVADYIAQKKGIPFRTSYNIVSEVVLECQKKAKLDLDKLNQRLMRLGKKNLKLRKTEWALLCSPHRLVERKKHIGAPGSESTNKNLTALKRELTTQKNWLAQKQKIHDDASLFLQKEIKKVMQAK